MKGRVRGLWPLLSSLKNLRFFSSPGWVLCLLLPVAVAGLSRGLPGFALRWSRVLGSLVRGLAVLSGALPFPALEAAAAALAAGAALGLLRRRWKKLVKAGRRALAALLSGYLALWYPLYFVPGARASFPSASPAELGDLALELSQALADTAEEPPPDPEDFPRQAAEAVAALGELPFAGGAESLPRAARIPGWMPVLKLAGFYSPWTGEALYSTAMPLACQPFTACHELAHLGGLADEGAANIAAYRACLRAGGCLRRSAWLHALAQALPRLRQEDPEAWAAAVEGLDPGSLEALRALGGLAGTPERREGIIGRLLELLGIREAAESYGTLADYLAEAGSILGLRHGSLCGSIREG